jgi:hypothetical protein
MRPEPRLGGGSAVRTGPTLPVGPRGRVNASAGASHVFRHVFRHACSGVDPHESGYYFDDQACSSVAGFGRTRAIAPSVRADTGFGITLASPVLHRVRFDARRLADAATLTTQQGVTGFDFGMSSLGEAGRGLRTRPR